ncbi:MAG: flagellar motor switch protein FliM [Burkholderiales bacterium]|jgi:flagellar motor switch protein FliM|uniref:flagellar motor switch protein FliM n=1 Tax=Limnohabitans sp. TaxID=1907725 RepID=UPI0025DA2FA8|nr:flagellar motor switch protein FliM [Limnohabitans sp.]
MAENQPLLSAEELAALSAGIHDGTLDVDTGYNLDAHVRKYDLVAEDSSLGVNLSSLDMINERFIRLFRLGMLEVLRTSPRINPSHAQIMRFGHYIRDLKAPLSVNIIRMASLRGYAMVVIEPTMVFSSLDSFFGGFGRGVGQLPPGRLFTLTETRIIKIILQVFFRSFKEAWSPVAPIDFEHVSSEINPQFAQIADDNDLVVLSRFESENTTQGAGFIDMVIPYGALKPVRDLLRSRVQTGDGNEESDKVWRAQLADAVKDADLEIQILLGKLHVSLQQLQTMQAGDVLPFKKAESARAMIQDMPVYDVEVGAMGSQVAVKIVQAISPHTPA